MNTNKNKLILGFTSFAGLGLLIAVSAIPSRSPYSVLKKNGQKSTCVVKSQFNGKIGKNQKLSDLDFSANTACESFIIQGQSGFGGKEKLSVLIDEKEIDLIKLTKEVARFAKSPDKKYVSPAEFLKGEKVLAYNFSKIIKANGKLEFKVTKNLKPYDATKLVSLDGKQIILSGVNGKNKPATVASFKVINSALPNSSVPVLIKPNPNTNTGNTPPASPPASGNPQPVITTPVIKVPPPVSPVIENPPVSQPGVTPSPTPSGQNSPPATNTPVVCTEGPILSELRDTPCKPGQLALNQGQIPLCKGSSVIPVLLDFGLTLFANTSGVPLGDINYDGFVDVVSDLQCGEVVILGSGTCGANISPTSNSDFYRALYNDSLNNSPNSQAFPDIGFGKGMFPSPIGNTIRATGPYLVLSERGEKRVFFPSSDNTAFISGDLGHDNRKIKFTEGKYVVTSADGYHEIFSALSSSGTYVLTKIIFPNSLETKVNYDSNGILPLSIIDGLGNVTTLANDGTHIVQIKNNSRSLSLSYDTHQRLDKVSLSNGSKILIDYTNYHDYENQDLQYRPGRISYLDTKDFGPFTTYEYDNVGKNYAKLVSIKNKGQKPTTIDYTKSTLTIHAPTGAVKQFSFDNFSRVVQEESLVKSIKDGSDIQQSLNVLVRDGNGRVVESSGSFSKPVKFDYDSATCMVKTISKDGNLSEFTRDPKTGNPLKFRFKAAVGTDFTTTMTYNKDGRLVTTENSLDGSKTEIEYVKNNKTSDFETLSLIESVTKGAGKTTYQYHPEFMYVTNVKTTFNGQDIRSQEYKYTRNELGNPEVVSVSDGAKTTSFDYETISYGSGSSNSDADGASGKIRVTKSVKSSSGTSLEKQYSTLPDDTGVYMAKKTISGYKPQNVAPVFSRSMNAGLNWQSIFYTQDATQDTEKYLNNFSPEVVQTTECSADGSCTNHGGQQCTSEKTNCGYENPKYTEDDSSKCDVADKAPGNKENPDPVPSLGY